MHILGTQTISNKTLTICIFYVLYALVIKLYYMHILGTQIISSKTLLYAYSRYSNISSKTLLQAYSRYSKY